MGPLGRVLVVAVVPEGGPVAAEDVFGAGLGVEDEALEGSPLRVGGAASESGEEGGAEAHGVEALEQGLAVRGLQEGRDAHLGAHGLEVVPGTGPHQHRTGRGGGGGRRRRLALLLVLEKPAPSGGCGGKSGDLPGGATESLETFRCGS